VGVRELLDERLDREIADVGVLERETSVDERRPGLRATMSRSL
jgi:hypothetical protein